MSFFKGLFKTKEDSPPINSYDDFWQWFVTHEKSFFKAVKTYRNVHRGFLNKLGSKLDQLRAGIFYLTGMYDDDTVELIFTPDGNVANFYVVEELVSAAPKMEGWIFTALKSPNTEDLEIKMGGLTFKKEHLSFYFNDQNDFPDQIGLTILHPDRSEENKNDITNGAYLFLENFLGEYNFATLIDYIQVTHPDQAIKDLIPLEKLPSFLKKREQAVIEKYDTVKYQSEEEKFSVLEAQLENGLPLISVMNMDLLNWQAKPSHPWIANLQIPYKSPEYNGLPGKVLSDRFTLFEDAILSQLTDFKGHLYIGKQSGDHIRSYHFATKNFKQCAKIIHEFQEKYKDDFDIDFEIVKDKYWQTFEQFNIAL